MTAVLSSIARGLRRPGAWVGVVAVLYGIAQLSLLDVERFLAWDEAVYISEVSPFAEAVGMGAHRGRGLALIVAPVSLLTDSMTALRIYLAAVSSAALFAAFLVWCRTIVWAAPVGAALFGSSWLAIFHGSAVYPNLYSALLGVAVIGIAFRYSDSPRRRLLYLITALLAVAAVVRPLEALIVVVSVVVVGLVAARPLLRRLAVAGLAGLGLGAVPWAIEAWVRFGGPLERLETSGELVGSGLHNNVMDYLRLLDGSQGPVNRGAATWLGVLLILGVIGLLSRDRRARQASVITMIAAILLVTPYVFATQPVTPRFMLPGLAMLSLSSALGATNLATRARARSATMVGLAVVLAVTTVWNLGALSAWDDRQVRNGETALLLGQAIREEADGSAGCLFWSPFNHPAIAFASGCHGAPLGGTAADNRETLETARGSGSLIFVVTVSDEPETVIGAEWECGSVPSLRNRGWQLCAPQGQ